MSQKKCKQPVLLQIFLHHLFQAMFHPPTGLNENVQHFLSLAEAQKIIADLNKILHKTAFNPRVPNPCFLLAVLISFGSIGMFSSFMTSSTSSVGIMPGLDSWKGKLDKQLLTQAHLELGPGLGDQGPYNENLEERWGGEKVNRDDISSRIGLGIGGLLFGGVLPYLCFFVLVAITKSSRKRQLTSYVAEWNR